MSRARTQSTGGPSLVDVASTVVRRDRWGRPLVGESEPGGWGWLVWSFVCGAPLGFAPTWRGVGSARVAAGRLALVVAGVLAGYGYVVAPEAVAWRPLWWSWLVAAVALVWWGWRAAAWLAGGRHRRRWVRPLALALRGELGYPGNFPARCWLRVPAELAEDPDGVRVLLPAGFVPKPKAKAHIEDIVRRKLGLGDIQDPQWLLVSGKHEVVFRAKVRPPARAAWRDRAVRDLVARARASRPVIGLSAGERPVAVDLDSESPHMVVSAGTGAGKSNMLRGVAAQLMHHGASLLVLDIKRRSHRWAKGLEGVTYCRSIAEIHNALIAAADEAMARNVKADDYPDDAEPPWQRRVVILEEVNATMEELGAYWREDLAGKGTSPAVRAYRQILFMGRQVKTHILAASQRFDAQAAGGPAARAQFGTVVMSRFKPAAWKMLVPEITPIPKASTHTGRGWVAVGGEAPETQIIYWTEAESRAHAAAGRSSAVRDLVAGVAGPDASGPQGEPPATVAGRPHLHVVADAAADTGDEREGVSLWRASLDKGDAVVGLKYDNLRQAANRDPEFPKPIGKTGRGPLYDPDTLSRWAANRERAGGTSA